MILFLLYGLKKIDKTASISHISFIKNIPNVKIIILSDSIEPILLSWYNSFNVSFSNQPIKYFFYDYSPPFDGIILCNYYTYFFPKPNNFINFSKINLFYDLNFPHHINSNYPIFIPQKYFHKLPFIFFLYFYDCPIYNPHCLLLKKNNYVIHNSNHVF
uniref:Uncharacterized protein n=1 Tax=viral metagenome TaxID=1070528 RepID=A0A6C0H6S6_9ZZZZ